MFLANYIPHEKSNEFLVKRISNKRMHQFFEKKNYKKICRKWIFFW